MKFSGSSIFFESTWKRFSRWNYLYFKSTFQVRQALLSFLWGLFLSSWYEEPAGTSEILVIISQFLYNDYRDISLAVLISPPYFQLVPRGNAFLLGSSGANFRASLSSKQTLVRVCLFQDLVLRILSSNATDMFHLFTCFNVTRNKKILPSK